MKANSKQLFVPPTDLPTIAHESWEAFGSGIKLETERSPKSCGAKLHYGRAKADVFVRWQNCWIKVQTEVRSKGVVVVGVGFGVGFGGGGDKTKPKKKQKTAALVRRVGGEKSVALLTAVFATGLVRWYITRVLAAPWSERVFMLMLVEFHRAVT